MGLGVPVVVLFWRGSGGDGARRFGVLDTAGKTRVKDFYA